MIETRTVTIGERIKMGIEVKSLSRTPFEIKNPSFDLYCGDELEANGVCEVVEITPVQQDIYALIRPLRANTKYRLIYHYDIGDERLIYECEVRVRGLGGSCYE